MNVLVQSSEFWSDTQTRAIAAVTTGLSHLETVLADPPHAALTDGQMQQVIQQQKALITISQRIRRSLDPRDILQSAVVEIKQALRLDRVVIYRLVGQNDAITVAEAVEPQWSAIMGSEPSIAPWQHLPAEYWTTPQVVNDVQASNLPVQILELARQREIQAWLTVPIRQDDVCLGMLCAHQCAQPRQWQNYDIDLVVQLADQLAIALQQSDQFQQVQQLNADLEQEVQQRTEEVRKAFMFDSTLKRITDKVRDSLDEEQILQAAVKELTLALELGGCNSALYDLDQGTSTIHYEYTNSVPAYQGRVAQMDRYPEIYHQLKQGYCFQFCSLVPNPVRGHVAMLACPIFVDPNSSQGVDQSILGDLWLIHHKGHIFSEFEIRLVEQVASQCAIAIRQARLYQAAQVQVQELAKLNNLKDEFLSTVSHELRTPITNVKMAIHMLKLASTEEKRQRYLDILETETFREAELIDELLDLQRLEAGFLPITPEVINLNHWVAELLEPFRSRIASQHQRLVLECPTHLPSFTTDVNLLRRILMELLNNACKYTPEQHDICFSIDVEAIVEDLRREFTQVAIFQLKNQTEIPASDLPHIFEKFYRVIQSDRYKRGGTGLGLALVQKRVEQLKGTIEVDSRAGWTTFTIRIPNLG